MTGSTMAETMAASRADDILRVFCLEDLLNANVNSFSYLNNLRTIERDCFIRKKVGLPTFPRPILNTFTQNILVLKRMYCKAYYI
jgi:hypothetical protein